MSFETIYLSETDSTNSWLKAHGDDRDLLVWTDYQTAGRGCGTNTWESERGKNILFSALVHPANVLAREQFILSMAEALAVKEALDGYADGILLKWPNDIYWHDRKISGTLIETTLGGEHIRSCIFGTGVNVNQTLFRSNAPNPVSLCQITGHEVDCRELLQPIASRLQDYMALVASGQWPLIRARYRACLYRRGEAHWYILPDGRRRRYMLKTVEDNGTLLLEDCDDHEEARFGFKEIAFSVSA